MDIPIKQIIKFISELYKPSYIDYTIKDVPDGPAYSFINAGETPYYFINIGIDEIDEKYLKNPNFSDPIYNKERNLEYEIREEIKSFFGINTTGLRLSKYGATSPWEHHQLSISVRQTKS